jgi:hypothetical protein
MGRGIYVHHYDGDVPMDPYKDESCGGVNIKDGLSGVHHESIDCYARRTYAGEVMDHVEGAMRIL